MPLESSSSSSTSEESGCTESLVPSATEKLTAEAFERSTPHRECSAA